MRRRAIGKSATVIIILILVLTSSFLYYNYVLTEADRKQNSLIANLQGTIAILQNRNNELERQLGSSGSSNTNISIGLNPVKVYSTANSSVVTVQGVQVTNTLFGPQIQSILGSGFVINYSGSFYVVTNFHVVNGITNATVSFWNGDAYKAKVIGTDPYSDLAVVSVDAPKSEFRPLSILTSSLLKVGQPVIAIGNPFGLSGSMTFGIISQLGRTISESTAGGFAIADIIQFSAPINPGNSGGPLLNADGSVIGITTAVVGGSQGLGFAIPSNTVLRELPFLIGMGKYDGHPYMGIGGTDMNYDLAQVTKSVVTYGVLIANVVQGGPADRAGLKAGSRTVQIGGQQYTVGGDIIISLNGSRIMNQEALSTYLEEHATSGQRIQVGIVRDGNPITVTLILGSRPAPKV